MAYKATILLIGLLTVNSPLAVAQTNADLEAVKAANHALYLAVSARDVSAVQRVWASDDGDIQNIGATSKAPAIGWDNIKKAYGSSFERFPEISVNMVEPLVRLHGQTAEVVGLERQILKQADEVVLRLTTLATNVFEKQSDGTWLLVSRHSSIPR
jgi:ketosteroid isomerase-like protein